MQDKQQEENTIGGEYLTELVLKNQHETYTGFWEKLLNFFTLKGVVIFRHMKNKWTFIDISLCDLIWIIFLCSFTLGTAFSFGTYYCAKKHFESEYEQYHLVLRQYHDSRHMLPTKLPDYVRGINDMIPCKDYSTYVTWVLRKRFDTQTNYYYVAKRDGQEYLQEVSDEEYERAVRQHYINIETQRRTAEGKRGQDLLKRYNDEKKRNKK